jgi:hypothetical protein
MKIYAGLRNEDGSCSVTVNGHPLDPRLDWQNHSPTGFEWGFGGSGPDQLALAILADCLGEKRKELALHFYQKFKADVVSVLPHAAWGMTGEEVRMRINTYLKVARVWRSYWQARKTDQESEAEAPSQVHAVSETLLTSGHRNLQRPRPF